MDNLTEKKKTFFETKVLPILSYVGLIGAVIMSIAYIVVVVVLINGFKAEELLQTTVFACVNAAVGFVIMQFLKVQGVSFAKMIPENMAIIKQYYTEKTKDKKARSITYFWWTSVVKDIFVKCASLGVTTIGVIYIVIKGSNDYNLLLLAFVNLLMFICFGFLSLTKAYDFFNQSHIPYMREQLAKNEPEIGTETKDNLTPYDFMDEDTKHRESGNFDIKTANVEEVLDGFTDRR